MKPRDITETQRMRALTLGIQPVLIDENVKRMITNLGCVVETSVSNRHERITLSCPKDL